MIDHKLTDNRPIKGNGQTIGQTIASKRFLKSQSMDNQGTINGQMNAETIETSIEYYSSEQVAQILGISERTLRRYSALLQEKLSLDFDRKKRETGYSAKALELLKKFCELRSQCNMPLDRCVSYLLDNL